MIDFIAQIPTDKPPENPVSCFIAKPQGITYFRGEEYELVLWGDPLGAAGYHAVHSRSADHSSLVREVSGHYYYLLLDTKKQRIVAGNSMFGILPLYYAETRGGIFLSNNAVNLGIHLGLKVVSRRFVLETMLFNYPLFNHSFIDTVSLLPSNSCLAIGGGGWRVLKHTRIEEYFLENPRPWRKSGVHLSEVFLSTVKKYLPDGKYVNSLTGGFDSRTLAAAGLFHGKDFICSAFGAPGSKDVVIGEKVAAATNLAWLKILLDDEYVRNYSLENGLQFICNASGSATFVRGHYLHAARILAGNSSVMVTGNFGSELFRAAHVRGVVFSPNLTEFFSNSDRGDAFQKIEESCEFSVLGREAYASEWEELKQDLATLPCYNTEYGHLTLNQQFYVFVFEEVFRKYFGAEMASQFTLLKNRTPYLDFDFITSLLESEFAGVYSGFFEHNPLRRYKGQVLYSHIIRKAWPEMGKIISDKGYRPEDLLTLTGQMSVFLGYARKKSKPTATGNDPYSVNRSFEHNIEFYRSLHVDRGLFAGKQFPGDNYSRPDSTLFKVLSLSWLKERIEEKPYTP